MKGLAKKNNKTRGKITHRKKNNRKTIRKGKKCGGNDNDKNVSIHWQNPSRYTDEEIKKMKINAEDEYNLYKSQINKDFDEIVDKLENRQKQAYNGEEETKNIENEQPNKKKKLNTKIMNEIKNEYDIAVKARKEKINNLNTNAFKKIAEIKQIEKNEEEQRKKEEIEYRNLKEAMKKSVNLEYLEPETDPRKGEQISQEQQLDEDAKKQAKEDYTIFKDAITFNGGKKRKTHKKRK